MQAVGSVDFVNFELVVVTVGFDFVSFDSSGLGFKYFVIRSVGFDSVGIVVGFGRLNGLIFFLKGGVLYSVLLYNVPECCLQFDFSYSFLKVIFSDSVD